ncbi:MAG: hypothetical protein CO105_11970 [Comamonadaceae bacterium CG_4_9_14_3_um_filter_60_33]|nr:MAG: hypothetical protein AUK51_13505 [Comamonadaceae bacterium CG2_30_59_20]PIY29281.1 MAG: hypothetical protein COZ09_05520 [Comamonadaceae bacterium CG_4_10_14_3_um_filter_60_42]PJB42027.1 MAG: hypothetical protein CO105_11970 [Comamonadaceae bacterium CG_4_9_14_3_um_filter_60_33]
MKHLFSTKSLAAVAVALGALATVSSAQARSDVYFSIGVQVPGFYVQPAPVYVQPPQFYRPAPIFYAPAPSYYAPAPSYYQRHDNGRRYGAQHWQRSAPYGHQNRDGVRNQRDRDGDGLRNRYDRHQDNPYRR